MNPDVINGSLEFIGGCMCWANVWTTLKDKFVGGVRWWTTGFFAFWGYWNLYYYPSLDQWWSLAGSVWLVLGNTVWVLLLIYYGTRQHDNPSGGR